MKNFKYTLFALFAIIAGFAITSCTQDPLENKGDKVGTKVEVAVVATAANGATIEITTQNVKEFAYVQRESEIPRYR